MSPTRAIAAQFLRSSPLVLLAVGIGLSTLDAAALYGAASDDGVLYLKQGIGLFQNYGLCSTLLGNTVFLYLAKKYYDAVCQIRRSDAVTNSVPIERSLSVLTQMIKMERPFQFLIYLLLVIGAIYWFSNVGFHVIGNPEVRWGHKVFDSPDHRLTFYASRLHNLYTWLAVYPVLAYVMIFTSIQLQRMMADAIQTNALRYDVLNPDRQGGFLFAQKAHIIFTAVIALVYIQITMHIETFERVNAEHVIAFSLASLLLIGVNRIFLGNVYSTIRDLRHESLNRIKNSVYNDDKLSFEILKYCLARRTNIFTILSGAVKTSAIVISGAIKLWPHLRSAYSSLIK